MASSKLVSMILLLANVAATHAHATWCVAKSDASSEELESALNYACGAGADCLPLQPNGLCFLPNTMQAHASYAFNSFYQINAKERNSCDFSGTATISKRDPSYGTCMYPSHGLQVEYNGVGLLSKVITADALLIVALLTLLF